MKKNIILIIIILISILSTKHMILKEQIEDDKFSFYINIAKNIMPKLELLIEDEEAYTNIAKIELHFHKNRALYGFSKFRQDINKLETLSLFAEKYSGARAILICKFLMGKIILNSYYSKDGQEILNNIIKNYPSTLEAKFSYLFLTSYLINETEDPYERKKLLIEEKTFIENFLKEAKDIDNNVKNNLYLKILQLIILKSENDLFTPSLKISLGMILEEFEDYDGAIKIYNEIIRDYPGTQSAKKAKILINNIKTKEMLKNYNFQDEVWVINR
ncbi:MAG: hypothetical protein K6U03_00790 [Firmicutes bacterium]|nr:hypothetical protein [Bacillota bacterium]